MRSYMLPTIDSNRIVEHNYSENQSFDMELFCVSDFLVLAV